MIVCHFVSYREVINRIANEEEGASCNSSHISNKSEKNMNDFDGEDLFTEEELSHFDTVDQQMGSLPMRQHLANVAAFYKDQPRGWHLVRFVLRALPDNILFSS